MEQQLIDAMMNADDPEDVDDVSKAMIVARVTSALTEVREVTAEYIDKIKDIQQNHEMELKLGGLCVVLNVTDDIASSTHKGPTQMCILGHRDKALKSIAQLMEGL